MDKLKNLANNLWGHFKKMEGTAKQAVIKPLIFGLGCFVLCLFFGIFVGVGWTAFLFAGISILVSLIFAIIRVYQDYSSLFVTVIARCTEIQKPSVLEKVTDNREVQFYIEKSTEKDFEKNYFSLKYQQKRSFKENQLYEITFERKPDFSQTVRSDNIIAFAQTTESSLSSDKEN